MREEIRGFRSTSSRGLARLEIHAHRESTLTTLLRQFKNVLVIILLVSAGLSLYLRDGKTGWRLREGGARAGRG